MKQLSSALRRGARGLVASAARLLPCGPRRGERLAARVRRTVQRAVARPHAIEVTAEDGRVLLSGPVVAGELDALLSAVWRVRGVGAVDARLELDEAPEVAAGGRQGFRLVAVLSREDRHGVRPAPTRPWRLATRRARDTDPVAPRRGLV
jgi:hypothetical protein